MTTAAKHHDATYLAANPKPDALADSASASATLTADGLRWEKGEETGASQLSESSQGSS
jgi:hypothetical protein